MKTSPKNHVFFSLLISCLMIVSAKAQDEYVATTTENPEVETAILEHMLLPLTKAELEVEAAAWIDLLKAKVTEISQVRIQRATAEGDATGDLATQEAQLSEERTRIANRTKIVLEEFSEKGGDAEEFTNYAEAVTGIALGAADVLDFGYLATLFKEWLKSPEGGIKWGIGIVAFIITLIIAKIVAMMIAGLVRRAVERTQKNASALFRNFIVTIAEKLVFFVGLIVALTFIGVQVGPFLAALGAIGFIVGFALQGTLNNFAAGLMILMHRPFDVGDWVDAGGVSGSVESMNMGSTTIKSGDNKRVIVPNGNIWGNVITNVTGNSTRRVDLTFGIGYGDDMAKAEAILSDILANHPLVLKDPAPTIKVHELGDSSVNFICRPWTKTSDYWTVYWDVTRTVKERFDADGVSIPFPQRDVHMYQES